MDPDFAIITASAAGRERLLAASFERLTGRALVAPGADLAGRMWRHPAVIVAHGTQDDPVFFYGNRAALDLFEMDAATFTTLPSRKSAEPVERAERAQLMDRVTRTGLIDDYSGIRVAASGKRFRIEQALVWNLLDSTGIYRGQAATFDRWQPLPPRR